MDYLKRQARNRGYAKRIAKLEEFIGLLARMDTPTDGLTDEERADGVMGNLEEERLFSDASALYELIREARKLQEW